MFRDQIQVGDETYSTTYSLVSNQLLVRFAPDLTSDDAEEILQFTGARRIEEDPEAVTNEDIQTANKWLSETGWLWVVLADDGRTQQEFLEVFATQAPNVQAASPVYAPTDEGLVQAAAVLLHELLIEIGPENHEAVLDSLVARDDMSIDPEIGNRLAPFYTFQVTYTLNDPQQGYDVLEEVRGTSGVVNAEHGWMQLTGFYSLKPDDKEYSDPAAWDFFWGLREIHAEDGWTIREARGGAVVQLAIIDGGFEEHEDIEYHPDAPPTAFNGESSHKRHGVNVAGIAAAKTNNARGTASVGFDCVVLPIRLGPPKPEYVALSILDAVDLGASVINMSSGFPDLNPTHIKTIQSALQYAQDAQVVFVAAAGNSDREYVDYPARDPLAIGVGAIAGDLLRRNNSNYGIGLNLVAPGNNCWTTAPGNNYERFSATSCAAPHVAGLAALIRSIRPDLSSDAVRSVIQSTCRRIHQGSAYHYDGTVLDSTFGPLRWDPFVGVGLINCHAAMKAARDMVSLPLPEDGPHWDVDPEISPENSSSRRHCGYLGKSNSDGLLRVYCSLDFNEWLDIARADIIAVYPADPTSAASSLSRMTVVTQPGATVMHVRR